MPLLGIIGPGHAGKRSVADYLIHTNKFTELKINDSELPFSFSTLDEAIKYATSHWRDNLIIMDINRFKGYEVALKRPFFLLVWVDAPTTVRYKRYQQSMQDELGMKSLSINETNIPFHQFVLREEMDLYVPYGDRFPNSALFNSSTDLYSFSNHAHLKIFNPTDSLEDLYQKIDKLDILNSELTRPSWDTYFMALCELASKRSNCMKRRVGCIIVSQNRVISTGYNGTPKGVRNCNEGGCDRCNLNSSCGSSLDHCVCMHAEENALLEAGRERITNRKVTLYCNTCPCLGCAKKIIQVGISEVVYAQEYGMDTLTSRLFHEANVTLRQIKHTTVPLH